MVSGNALRDLLARAHRRSLSIQLATQAAYTLGVLGAGGSLLLLLGTQILHPLWVCALVAAAVGLFSYRLRHSLVSPYRLAQRIDREYGFHDSLSTALHFEREDNRKAIYEPLREYQHEQAEGLASQVNLAKVLPFALPRAAYAATVLFAMAAGLFAYRYGTTHKLDLRAPLVSFHIDAFTPQKEVAQERKDLRKQLQDQLKQMGISLNNPDGQEGYDPKSAQPFNTPGTSPMGDNAAATPGQEGSEKTDRQGMQGTSNEQIPGEKGDDSKGDKPSQSSEQGDAAGKEGSQDGKEGQSAQQSNNQQGGKEGKPGGDNSMMSKLRDNLANMLNKLKSPSPSNDSQQASQSKQEQSASNGEGKKGQPTPSRNNNQQNSQGEQQSDQQGEGGEKSQSASSKQGDKGSSQPSSDAKSGVGKQDGDKDVKAAEQLAAMGKLSELLGKRSQNVTGEVTVETPSGKQQLVTPYSQRRVTHIEAGGESNRDEVPLAYQRYVQQYFEQIHKGSKAEQKVEKP